MTAPIKIPDLPAASALDDADLIVVEDISGGQTSRATLADLAAHIGGGSSSDKIQDTAGTTRVETEEATGHVTTTADGHRVIDAGRYETTIETDTSDVLGEGTLAASRLHLLNHEGGLAMRLGVELSAEYPGEDPFEFFSGVSSKTEDASLGTWGGAIGGPITSKTTIVVGQGTAAFEHAEPGENPNDPPTITRVPVWDETAPGPLPEGMNSIVHGLHVLDGAAKNPLTEDLDAGGNRITDLGAPSDPHDAARLQDVEDHFPAEVRSPDGTAVIRTLDTGNFSFDRLGTVGVGYIGSTIRWGRSAAANIVLPNATDAHAELRSGGVTTLFTGAGYEALPAGISSYMQGIVTALARVPQPWAPSWSGDINVDSVSHVEASVKDEGDYIDVEGALTVTPDAAGVTVVTASIGVAFAGPDVDKDGQGSAGVPGVAVQAAGCRVSTGGTVSVTFDAASNAEHTVSFRARYRKASVAP